MLPFRPYEVNTDENLVPNCQLQQYINWVHARNALSCPEGNGFGNLSSSGRTGFYYKSPSAAPGEVEKIVILVNGDSGVINLSVKATTPTGVQHIMGWGDYARQYYDCQAEFDTSTVVSIELYPFTIFT